MPQVFFSSLASLGFCCGDLREESPSLVTAEVRFYLLFSFRAWIQFVCDDVLCFPMLSIVVDLVLDFRFESFTAFPPTRVAATSEEIQRSRSIRRWRRRRGSEEEEASAVANRKAQVCERRRGATEEEEPFDNTIVWTGILLNQIPKYHLVLSELVGVKKPSLNVWFDEIKVRLKVRVWFIVRESAMIAADI
ncbi:hypothetical protein Syun_030657 [Stephania yunnanensis]|uniref:Uncharacterized protein n=1 Tax=Stephania yunnanensis TaxID=152371 RepID=A0AAP0E1W2_9MAGN